MRTSATYKELETYGYPPGDERGTYLKYPIGTYISNVMHVALFDTNDSSTGFTAWLQSLPVNADGIHQLLAFAKLCEEFTGFVREAVTLAAKDASAKQITEEWNRPALTNTAGKRVRSAGNLANQMGIILRGKEGGPIGIWEIWVSYLSYDQKLRAQESTDETLETATETRNEWGRLLKRAQKKIERPASLGVHLAQLSTGPYGPAESQMPLYAAIEEGLKRANAQLQEAQGRAKATPHTPLPTRPDSPPPDRPDSPPPLVYMPPGAEDVDGDDPIADSKGDESDGSHALSPIREPVDTSPNMSTEEKTNPSPAKLNPQPKGPDSWFRADGGGYDPRQPQISWVGGLRRGVSFGVASKLYKAVPFWHAVLLGVVDGAGLQAFTHTAWNRSMYAFGYDPRGSIGGSSETQTDRESVGGNQEGVFVNNASAVGRPQGAILDTAVDAAILNAMKPSAKLAVFAVLANAVDQVVSRGIEYGMTPDASGKALFGDFKLSNASDLRTYEMRDRQSMHYVPISEKKK